MARWLVHENVWGSLATTSVHLNGSAFANVLSFSDGAEKNSTGTIYMYLSPLDPTSGEDLPADPRATLSISEEPLGCLMDAEDPNCAKVMISGKMRQLEDGTQEHEAALVALFARHPQVRVKLGRTPKRSSTWAREGCLCAPADLSLPLAADEEMARGARLRGVGDGTAAGDASRHVRRGGLHQRRGLLRGEAVAVTTLKR